MKVLVTIDVQYLTGTKLETGGFLIRQVIPAKFIVKGQRSLEGVITLKQQPVISEHTIITNIEVEEVEDA